MLVDTLVKRRRHLLALARKRLSPGEHASHADDLSSNNLIIIFEMLEVSVPETYAILKMTECFSVYERIGYNCQAADLLYEAGFINVEDGRSPVSRLHAPYGDELCDYLDICCWFQSKGASLYSQSSETAILPIHHIAKCVGQWIGYPENTQHLREWKTAISRHATLLKTILVDKTEHCDSCSCACSVDGCLPSTLFLAEAARGLDWRSNHLLAKLFDFLGCVTPYQVKELHDVLAPVVLRLCTFEVLEITHTCRYHDAWGDDTRGEVELCDVPEIQSEQLHLINRLEELVFEFEGQYKELNVSLPEFLSGYWRTRMYEVQAEEEAFDDEEAQRMREVGVTVEYPFSDSE
ncbi:hypothetical protein BJX96DRAFT_1764 [Aspergillus floccosus]